MAFILAKIDVFEEGTSSQDCIDILKLMDVTHLLNLNTPLPFLNELLASGFVVKHVSFINPDTITEEVAIEIVDFIHDCVQNQQKMIYVHCEGEIDSSPTVIWLYLLSIGYSEQDATEEITSGYEEIIAPDPYLTSHLNLCLIKNRHTKNDKINPPN